MPKLQRMTRLSYCKPKLCEGELRLKRLTPATSMGATKPTYENAGNRNPVKR
jgi:hypothetical protein